MNTLRNKNYKNFSLFLAKRFVGALIFLVCFEALAFSAPILAAQEDEVVAPDEPCQSITLDIEANPYIKGNNLYVEQSLPKAGAIKTSPLGYHSMTAYNSEPGQTDDSPCITANGFNVCEHGIEDTVAANFLKFGTKIKIPELFGDRVFVVRDRMNKRYTDRVDVWMVNKQDALKFGVRVARIEVLD